MVLDVSSTFRDPDTDSPLILLVTSADDTLASATIDGTTLIVEGHAIGTTSITVSASDVDGEVVSDDFWITVNNVVPLVQNSIMNQMTTRIEALTLDISETFIDPDSDSALSFSVTTEDDTIANASVDGTMLRIEGHSIGTSTITLTATDFDGGKVSHEFMVTVNNEDPVIAFVILNQTTTRIDDLIIDISETFNDPDNDILTFAFTVADAKFVDAMIYGSTLRIRGLEVGSTTVTLTAMDVHDGTVSHDFMVEVLNTAPTVAMSIRDVSFDRRAPWEST